MSTLHNAVNEYLAMRKALGYQLHDAEVLLPAFVSFLERSGTKRITIMLALEWSQQPGGTKLAYWAKRLSVVRGFARFWSATDPSTEIPPVGLLPRQSRRHQPYLYSDEEIRKLMEAALNLPPIDGLRRWTYYCLFGILAVSGLRISEAFSLKDSDVDTDRCLLTIRQTKFNKSRIVPFHASTQRVLAEYAERRDHLLGRSADRYFLVNNRGTRLKGSIVRETFHKLSRRIGLRSPSDCHGPRLHDFRHRFAVVTLVSWYRCGQDVERCLPILSTFLGHAQVTDTYWYLSLCPELMGLATALLEQRWEGQS